MIENDQQADAVREHIAYWRSTLVAGGQSWLAGENTLQEIGKLQRRLEEYQRRTAAVPNTSSDHSGSS